MCTECMQLDGGDDEERGRKWNSREWANNNNNNMHKEQLQTHARGGKNRRRFSPGPFTTKEQKLSAHENSIDFWVTAVCVCEWANEWDTPPFCTYEVLLDFRLAVFFSLHYSRFHYCWRLRRESSAAAIYCRYFSPFLSLSLCLPLFLCSLCFSIG